MVTDNVLIGLSRSKGFFQWAVRKLTGSKVNHAFILYRSNLWGGWWAVQVDDKGVRIVPSEYLESNSTSVVLYSYERNIEHSLSDIRGEVGEDYDYAGILGFFIRIIAWKVAKKKIRNALHRKNELFCSELVAKFLRCASVKGATQLNPSTTSPQDILEFVQRDAGGFKQVDWPEDPNAI